MVELAPWLFLGAFLAAALHILIPREKIYHYLGNKSLKGIFLAALFGVPLPLCSCSVVPTTIGLHKQGAGKPAAMSFLISTPQTGVDSIMVSAAFLGWPFAIFKLVTAFILGLCGGGILYPFESKEDTEKKDDSQVTKKRSLGEFFNFALNDVIGMIWFWLLAGLLLAAFISVLLPENYIGTHIQNPYLASLLILPVATVFYVCATSSVPMAYVLIMNGLPLPAALVFLMAGPATNIATLGAIYKAFGKRFVIIYLSTIVIGSLAAAWIFTEFNTGGVNRMLEQHNHEPGLFSKICAILLFILFIYFIFRDLLKKLKHKDETMDLTIKISGMTCQGCVNTVERLLAKHDEIDSFHVDLNNGNCSLSGDSVSLDDLKTEINELGFSTD